ncbi:MAG: 2Fe-2S iron-sulfur cluster binding domain-containing protein [Alphaproteobacteria bacterium]|nr:2Fe-2S iron-sulfur cluster binding domain-containing protein [Alphaproteobacteria bacterium]
MPTITVVDREGSSREITVSLGQSLLEIAQEHNVDIEGICEGSMACATCHVIVEPDWYAKLPGASEDELDMLELAFDLTETSRLGCQLRITEELDGLKVTLGAV